MNIKILSVKEYGVSLKATIQSTGKLGFTKNTSDALGLTLDKSVKFAQDEEDNDTLFISIVDKEDEDAFGMLCASGYYSVNAKTLFDALNIEYQKQTVIFDLSRYAALDGEMNGEVYKMKKRILHKTDKPMTS